MSIHDFYSKLVSQNENALFNALRRLSLLPDPKCLTAEEDPSAMGGWIPWECDGPMPCVARNA
jgi:hypothetical protein